MGVAFDPGSLVAIVAALGAAGVVAGLLAGLLGIGGGIVIVPVLFHVFPLIGASPGPVMHAAVATSLATIVATSIASARAHYRRAAVDRDVLRALGPWVVAGVIVGTAVAGAVKGTVLTTLFALFALAIAANLALGREGYRLRDGLPGPLGRAGIGGTIGGVSSLLGIGGGILSVPALSACGYPIRTAVGTAAAIGLIIAIPGAIGFVVTGLDVPGRPPFSLGYVNLPGLALIVPATTLAAPWGARLAHTIRPTLLRRAFALFLVLTAIRMLASLWH
jgi:uncharacterized membrane protein YfcA